MIEEEEGEDEAEQAAAPDEPEVPSVEPSPATLAIWTVLKAGERVFQTVY